MKLSNNFSLNEMTKSQTAERKGISNNPSEDHMNSLKALCENVLQKVRDHYGKVVSISSGYRSPELCLAIGAAAFAAVVVAVVAFAGGNELVSRL